jgi:hypothetical protein
LFVRSAAIERQKFRLILVAVSLSLIGCGSASDRTLEETIEQFHKIDPTASVSIKNGDGSIRIYGADTNEMRLQAIKRAYSAKRLKQIAIDVSVQPSSVSIQTNFPPKQTSGLFDRSGTVDYTIVLPRTANISRLELANGEASVEEMRGRSVNAHLGRGRLFDHNCFSNVDFAVSRGTLTLAYEWWEPGKFSVQANITNGNVWASLPGDAALHLIAETVHGKIANDIAEQGERRTEPLTKVDMLVNGGGTAGIKMHATEGNIEIVEQNP